MEQYRREAHTCLDRVLCSTRESSLDYGNLGRRSRLTSRRAIETPFRTPKLTRLLAFYVGNETFHIRTLRRMTKRSTDRQESLRLLSISSTFKLISRGTRISLKKKEEKKKKSFADNFTVDSRFENPARIRIPCGRRGGGREEAEGTPPRPRSSSSSTTNSNGKRKRVPAKRVNVRMQRETVAAEAPASSL